MARTIKTYWWVYTPKCLIKYGEKAVKHFKSKLDRNEWKTIVEEYEKYEQGEKNAVYEIFKNDMQRFKLSQYHKAQSRLW